jgi:aminopeptidase
MRTDRVDALAEVLTEYSIPVAKGARVSIESTPVAEPLVLALYRRLLERGAYVRLAPIFESAEPIFYEVASEQQLDFVWETDKWLVENLDARFRILSETNTKRLSQADPEKQIRARKAWGPWWQTFMRRSAEKSLKWMVTLYPTDAYAMDADMSLAAYEDFFYRACLVDKPDPIGEWKQMAERQARIIDWLKGRKEVHIQGDGTDLKLGIEDRVFEMAAGEYNFPDGEIFTGPVEDQTQGVVTFSYPAIEAGRRVEGIRLEFDQGRVVKARAESNEEFLITTLDTDAGSRVLGELGIGTNYGLTAFTGSTLLDEKIGGTIHLALGASYPETGGQNHSAIHWDMVCDLRKGGRITVDGDRLMEDGKLLV